MTKEYRRAYYLAHREREIALNKTWVKNNPEKRRAQARKFRAAHPDYVVRQKEYLKQYRIKNHREPIARLKFCEFCGMSFSIRGSRGSNARKFCGESCYKQHLRPKRVAKYREQNPPKPYDRSRLRFLKPFTKGDPRINRKGRPKDKHLRTGNFSSTGVNRLADYYIRFLLARYSTLKPKDFPPEIVELQREKTRLLRTIRTKQ